jgi:hypothetical protein
MEVEYAVSNRPNNANKIIKISMARIEHSKYTSINEENKKIQPKNNGNYNDHMRIFKVSLVRIQIQKHNIPPQSRMFVA